MRYTRNTCMQRPLALLIKNSTIFWEHEVFVDCCHSNTGIYIFSVVFFQNSVKIMEKITVLILVLLTNFILIIQTELYNKNVRYYTPFFEKVCSYTHLRCAKLHTIFRV